MNRHLHRFELLDDPGVDDAIRLRALAEVAVANAYLGGTRVVLRELRRALRQRPRERLTILDVGTATGDIPAAIRAASRRWGIESRTIGVELSPVLTRTSHERGTLMIRADALRLPIATGGVDVVVCSQLMHHFSDAQAVCLARELTRVARRLVIVAELRRSWIAAGGFWLASRLLGFHPVTRHDGLVSVLRGFTRDELGAIAAGAGGHTPAVRRYFGYRVAAVWSPPPPRRTKTRTAAARGALRFVYYS